jgi:hypothetical protein
MGQKVDLDKQILDEILKSIQQINYGEVVITIHNSKIVQIEKIQKKRFDLKPTIQIEAKT